MRKALTLGRLPLGPRRTTRDPRCLARPIPRLRAPWRGLASPAVAQGGARAQSTPSAQPSSRREPTGSPAFTESKSYLSPATHPDKTTHKDTGAALAKDAVSLLQLYARPPLLFTHGKGAYLYDKANRPYLDFSSGIAVNALGHGNEDLAAVIAGQAKKLIHLSNLFHNEHAGKLAATLLAPLIARGGEWAQGGKVFFCNSGTEANEAAIKFARKYARATNSHPHETSTPSRLPFSSTTDPSTPANASSEPPLDLPKDLSRPLHPPCKYTILSYANAFHGRSMGALSATPSPKYQMPFAPLLPGFEHAKFNDLNSVTKSINPRIAGVLLEPIQGEGGVFPADLEWVRAVRAQATKVRALLVMDEIQCGLSRTGQVYAHFHYPGVTPDVLTLAKPLANGLPIGATIVTNRVAATLAKGDHGTTFGGSPFATAAAQHVVDRLTAPAFLEHVRAVGAVLATGLDTLRRESPLITQVRGKGLLLGIQFREGVKLEWIVDLCRERGLLVIAAGNNTLRVVPPLIVTADQAGQGLKILGDVLCLVEGLVAKSAL